MVPQEGRLYLGEVQNDKKNGEGISISEKEIYEGTYKDNIKMGGYEKNRDGVYEGEYLKGKRHGFGKFKWNNGEIFEGEWKNGKKNGHGIWKSPKGDFY